MSTMTAEQAKNWYWGGGPLPKGAKCLGVYAGHGRKGALIQLANGRLVQGNAGSIRTLPGNDHPDYPV